MTTELLRLVVPVNGSRGDERALEVAGKLAVNRPVAATLVYVVEVLQSMPLDAELPEELERGEQVLARAEALAGHHLPASNQIVSTDLLQARSAGSAIVDEAIERHADLVVMSTVRRSKHGKLTSGETSNFVMLNAPCEVIAIRLDPELESRGRRTP